MVTPIPRTRQGGTVVSTPSSRPTTRAAAPAHSAARGPIRRDEYVRRVREALAADYVSLGTSSLCELPGVVRLARTEFRRKIYPEASALRSLLDQAYALALEELDGLEARRPQQVATYLRLAREGMPLTDITRQLGLQSRSYVHGTIQRQALELVTEAFLQLARRDEGEYMAGKADEQAL